MTWSAILNSASWANACPVFGFRSHMGKLLLVIYLSCGRLRSCGRRRFPAYWPSTGFEIKTRRVSVPRNAKGPAPRGPGPSRFRRRAPGLDWLHVLCLEPFGPLGHVEADLLAFRERAKTFRVDGRMVAKDVLAAIVLRDEPKALRIVEPLHCTGCHALPSQSQTVNPPGPRAFWRGTGVCIRLSQGRQASNEGRPQIARPAKPLAPGPMGPSAGRLAARAPIRPPPRLVLVVVPESEDREVDGVGHLPVPEGVRMIAVVHPGSAHPGRIRGILHHRVPVDHGVTAAARADELVHLSPILLLRAARRVAHGKHGRADDAMPAGADPRDDFLDASDDLRRGGRRPGAVASQIVRPLEQHDVGHSGDAEHVALQPDWGRRAAALLGRIVRVRLPADGVAGDARVDDRLLPLGR